MEMDGPNINLFIAGVVPLVISLYYVFFKKDLLRRHGPLFRRIMYLYVAVSSIVVIWGIAGFVQTGN